MGGCVSTHHKASAMKVHVSSVFNRKPDDHTLIPPSPTKQKPPIINGNVAVKPQWPPLHSTQNSRDFGSKEETFFDSQAWLESDCEDDFMSVNGEFTPSRGNTPVHHSFSAGIPQNKGGAATIDDQKPSINPSVNPTKKKKRLSDLFKDSLREKHDVDEENGEADNGNGAVGSHGAVAVGVGGGGLKPKRERWAESVQVNGCLPRLLSSCRPVTPQQTEGQTK